MVRETYRVAYSALVFAFVALSAAAHGQDTSYHYDGHLVVTPGNGAIAASWDIAVQDTTATNVHFVLSAMLGHIRVEGADIVKSGIKPSALGVGFQDIGIDLKPANDGRTRHILMKYDGIPFPAPDSEDINTVSADVIELTIDSFWLPIDPGFNTLFTAELAIDTGPGWQGVGGGKLEATETGFHLSKSKPSLDIAFSLSKRFQTSQHNGFTLYDLRPDTAGTEALVGAISYCLEYLNSRFGQVDPVAATEFVINTRHKGGYSRGNYIALTDIRDTAAEKLTQFVCHEQVHHWSSGAKFDTVENWLNEAFAEYTGMLAMRERFGVAPYEARLDQFRAQVAGKDLPPVWTPTTTERPDDLVSYRKGPIALAALEQKIGPAVFMQFLKRYMAARIPTTPQLLDALEAETDTATRDWFVGVLAQ